MKTSTKLLLASHALCFLLGLWARGGASVRREADDGARLVCLVLSAPDNYERRQAIRDTWLRLVDGGVPHWFAVGTDALDEGRRARLRDEQREHGDLLLLPAVRDSYEGLARKLLAALADVAERHPRLRHLLKSDDDSFVRLDRIRSELEGEGEELYWGYFRGGARVRRGGRWAERGWWLCSRYLPYALGGGYVVGASAVRFIKDNARLLHPYNAEDVSLGVWTAPLRLQRRHDERFDTEWESRGCNHTMLVRHKQSPRHMRDMYRTLVSSGGTRLCDEEVQLRPSYRYDWTVSPDACCIVNK